MEKDLLHTLLKSPSLPDDFLEKELQQLKSIDVGNDSSSSTPLHNEINDPKITDFFLTLIRMN